MAISDWKKLAIIMAICLLVIGGTLVGILLNMPEETMTMNSEDVWTGNEVATKSIDMVTQHSTIETATFALG